MAAWVWRSAMILVTGANGFIGSALAARLERDGRDVLRGLRRPDAAKRTEGVVVLGDLGRPGDWAAKLKGVSCIVHTAARVHVLSEQARDPLREFRSVNVAGTRALAEHAAAASVKRLVFLSSIKVNGEATEPGQPFMANDEPRPLDPYGVSKWEAERELNAVARATGLEAVIVRPPLVYGPGVRANFRALMRALVMGMPLPLGAIDNRRSLVSVDNLVDVLVRCIDQPPAANRTFLVSDDRDVSTSELLRMLGEALGVRARLLSVSPALIKMGATLLGQSERVRRLFENLQLDISDTKRVLDWRPLVTLEAGLASTAQDYLRETRR
jgi:nucleoside-diphosphate-sugar epimerase